MKSQTYKIIENNKVLVSEKNYDSSNNVINLKDYSIKPFSEKKFTYNSFNMLISELEISDGKLLNKIENTFDENQNLIESKIYFGNEIYEKISTEFNEVGYIKTTYQEGIEIERMERINNGKNFENKFYEENELVEIHKYQYESSPKTGVTKIFDSQNNLLAIRNEYFDSNDYILKFEEFNANEQLMEESIYERENELILKETQRDFYNGAIEYISTYEYDFKKNLIRKEIRAINKSLVSANHNRYDEKNRLIEENRISNGENVNYQHIYSN